MVYKDPEKQKIRSREYYANLPKDKKDEKKEKLE